MDRTVPAASPWTRSLVLSVACAALIVTLSMGVRQSFGLFMQPLGRDLGLTREVFGFAIAVQNLLFGLCQPFVGALSERWGTRATLAGGAVVYAIGLLLAAFWQSSAGILVGLGFAVGLALSATTFVVVLAAVGKRVPAQRRGLAFGIVTAGGSFGQFAVVPLAQGLLNFTSWQVTLIVLAALAGLIALAGFGIARAPAPGNGLPAVAVESLGAALRRARAWRHYWLLNVGFFVCGFHVAFVGTHLPAYLVDRGISASVGAWALALIGLFNIAGSWLFGAWGDRHSRPKLLAALYTSRAVAMAVFLLVPLAPSSALAFAASFGFLWLGTVPLTSGAVASMFGITHLSTLYGVVFLSHQVGAFFGAWGAGWWFERTGSYDSLWWISIAIALLAALASLLTDDAPAPRPLPQAVTP